MKNKRKKGIPFWLRGGLIFAGLTFIINVIWQVFFTINNALAFKLMYWLLMIFNRPGQDVLSFFGIGFINGIVNTLFILILFPAVNFVIGCVFFWVYEKLFWKEKYG